MALQVGETYHGSVYRVTRINKGTVYMADTGMVSAYDKKRYEHIPGLAEVRTAQTVLALGFLKRHDLPVAFANQVDAITIACRHSDMLKAEWITRSRHIGSYLERHPETVNGSYPNDGDLVHEVFSKLSLDMNGHRPRWLDGNDLHRRLQALDAVERQQRERNIFNDPYLLPVPGKPLWEVHDAHAVLKPGQGLCYTRPLLNKATLAQRWRVAVRAFMLFKDAVETLDLQTLGLPMERVEMVDWKIEFTTDGLIGDVVNLDTMRLLKNGQLGKENQISKQVFRDGGNHADVLKVYELGLRIFEQLR